MEKDSELIPHGQNCYRLVPIAPGEVLDLDVWRYGMDLREFPYRGGWKEVLRPYWRRTGYGTVRCEFLDREVFDEDDDAAREKVAAHFGGLAEDRVGHSLELADHYKICDVHYSDEPQPGE